MRNITKKFLRGLVHKFQEAEYQYAPLGIACIYLLLEGYLWHRPVILTISETWLLGSISLVLLIPLLSKKLWPVRVEFLRPFYWYLALLYILPFCTTFLLLKHSASPLWLLISMLSTIVMLMFADWFTASLLFVIGLLLAVTLYFITTTAPDITTIRILSIVILNGMLLTFCGFFMYRREKFLLLFKRSQLQQEKLQTMSSIATSIAHELRTPLRTISLGANGIKECLPKLIESYNLATAAGLKVPFINQVARKNLLTVLDNIKSEVESSFTFINMLLTNVDPEKVLNAPVTICSMAECIDEALQRYPFNGNECAMIQFDRNNDFSFSGNKLLIIHLLFNLIKNALYHMTTSRDPQISIKLSSQKESGQLIFRDTGDGIEKAILPHIFERFYSKTHHGSGIGLAFCKLVMDSLGGKIECRSESGKFTEFSLYFPNSSAWANNGWRKLINKNLAVLKNYPSI